MRGTEREVATVMVLACIGLLAYGAQAERPEKDVARHGPASFNVWHGDIPHDIAMFSSRGSKYYRERDFYRHGKSNFMRRRHRTFAFYGYPGRGRYFGYYPGYYGYYPRHRFHLGRRR